MDRWLGEKRRAVEIGYPNRDGRGKKSHASGAVRCTSPYKSGRPHDNPSWDTENIPPRGTAYLHHSTSISTPLYCIFTLLRKHASMTRMVILWCGSPHSLLKPRIEHNFPCYNYNATEFAAQNGAPQTNCTCSHHEWRVRCRSGALAPSGVKPRRVL